LARANHTGTQAVSTLSATGTPSSSTYLRGDGVWATPAGGGGSSTGVLTLINVKLDFGATGNGSTNDTTAINNAIAACSTAGGGIVYFPPGTYMTDGGHSIPARVNILGCEPSPQYWVYNGSASPTSACALKIRTGTAQTSMFTTSSSSLAWSIRDITLIGNNVGSSIQGIAPVAPSSEQNSTVENVAVIGFSSHGIGGSWQAARFSTVFVGSCGGYGLNCSGSAQWADIMFDHSFVTGNKLGGLNIDSTASGNGLLNFTDTRFERSGWNPNAINTPTNVGGPGIRIRGNAKKVTFTGCSTDANSGSGLDIDRTSGRFLFNISFVSCLFCRDGFGNMSTLGEYAGVKVRGTAGNTVDFISFANCFVEAGLADDGGTAPPTTHPKYGLWLENTTYNSWVGGRLDANSTAIYGGTAGWSTNYKPLLSIPERNLVTMPYWSDNASRPSPVTDGMFGINGTSNKVEFYWGGWHTVTSS
jgi:hypothetical protein